MKAAAVPREVSMAGYDFIEDVNLILNAFECPEDIFGRELASSDAAPTELNMLFNLAVHRLAKLKHPTLRALNPSLSFVLFLAPTLSVISKASDSRLNQLEVSSKSV
jgi:hypothetical protein